MRDLSHLDRRIAGTVLVAGVGRHGRGDDAAGSVLARRLLAGARALAVDCGDRPEDFTREMAAPRADTILIVDAVDMGRTGGEMAVFAAADVRDHGPDTHRASLVALMRYLEMRTGATVLLLGIQPAVVADTPVLSPPVAAALDALEDWFAAASPAL